jgi:hypothetical protein
MPGRDVELKEAPEFDRINSCMNAGNKVRERSSSEAILAAWALLQIKNMRDAGQPVLRRTAHILRSIKHPAEAHEPDRLRRALRARSTREPPGSRRSQEHPMARSRTSVLGMSGHRIRAIAHPNELPVL